MPGLDEDETRERTNLLWLTAYPDAYGVKPGHDGR
jgi:hypothetical protein